MNQTVLPIRTTASFVRLRPVDGVANQMDQPSPNRELFDALIEAYRPCQYFGTCREAIWNPKRGYIPRGFLGATANLADVEIVMVFARTRSPAWE